MKAMEATREQTLFGLAAEFDSPERVLDAARKVYEAGYRRAEAYSPFAVEGLSEALGFHRSHVPPLVLAGAVTGAVGGFFMLWYANVISYPWNIGGRPPNSWPAFIPITFEMGVLFAGIVAAIGMLALNRLPMPYHPMFNVPNFGMATRDRFFICIERSDPQFDLEKTGEFLKTLGPLTIAEVPE